jgi:hypothetical protein
MTWGAFGVTWDAFGTTCGAFRMTWGPFGMTWDAQWSPKEDLTLLQARLGGNQGNPSESPGSADAVTVAFVVA